MADARRPPSEAPPASEAETVSPGRSERIAGTKNYGGSRIEPGLLLGHTWVVEEFLGRGGMGEVWRCRHIELGTEHAVKIILPELSQEPNFVALFKEEARRLSRLVSDAIVRYEGLFRDEWGRLYLVMEYVDGVLLSKLLEDSRLSELAIGRLLQRVALGLATAHEQGVLHRDVSPDNIILPEGRLDRAKIIDFGIAKSLDPADISLIGHQFAGKKAFVSPEQAGLFGGRVDARSDIYSLGLVLAAAALGHGRRLDMGSSPAAIIQHRMTVPDLSELPPRLQPLIGWMLQPDPNRRPQSMRALLLRAGLSAPSEAEAAMRSLREFAADRPPALVRPPALRVAPAARDARPRRGTPALRPLRPRRRWRWPTTGGVLALAAIGIVGFYYDRFGNPFLDVEPAITAARDAAHANGCALLDVTGARERSSVTLQVDGIVGGAENRDRLKGALGDIPEVGRVIDETVSVSPTLCPALRSLAALFPVRVPESLDIQTRGVAVGGPGMSFDIVQKGPSPAVVYVDAFWADGTVAHLLANKVMMPGQRIRIDGASLPPSAQAHAHEAGLISAIGASKLLLAATQPTLEDGSHYAVALKRAVDEAAKSSDALRFSGTWLALRAPDK